MRMREFVARMPRAQLLEIVRCPYEWYEPLKGRKPVCTDCSTCLTETDYGLDITDGALALKKIVSGLTATKMSRALLCPYEWFDPLKDKTPVCEYGADCNRCIQEFLIGCDSTEFRDKK